MVRSSIKERKKRGPRLSDGVIVRQWCESECHYHVKESRAFCKTRAWSVQLTTPYGRNLTKVRDNKLRHIGINVMYVGVKLLNKHDGTPHGFLKQRFPISSPNDFGERNVGKIRQNDLAFWMNAMGLEVLKEVCIGLLITKLNMKG